MIIIKYTLVVCAQAHDQTVKRGADRAHSLLRYSNNNFNIMAYEHPLQSGKSIKPVSN